VRNWVVVDLDAIHHNYERLRARAGGRPVLAVLKANAYGHGAPRIARFLQRLGCERLAVATVEEALSLRDAGLRVPIQMLACVPPADYARVVGEDFVFTVGSIHEAETLASTARRAGSRETVHVEIDTGMGRSGCRPADAPALVGRIRELDELALEGAMTHFPSADDAEDPAGADFARRQVADFRAVETLLREAGVDAPLLHAANSAGIACVPEGHLSFVRPGGALFGVSSGPRTCRELTLRTALSWRATVVQVRDFAPSQTVGYGRAFTVTAPMRVATIAVGYGDGFARAYGPAGYVLVRGGRAPVVGRISMDSTCIDVTALGDVATGEEVVLLGRQGDETIRAEDLGARAQTSPYEVTCRISARVPRRYAGGEGF
jgi:alanine racemase